MGKMGVGGERPLALTGEEIVEAQGWIINDRGVVELVAHKTDINGSGSQPKDLLVFFSQVLLFLLLRLNNPKALLFRRKN